jgi:hypothetical protein
MTAVEKLEAMVETKLSQPMSANFKELFDQAKEMEKQQIIDAFNLGQQKEAKQEFWTKGESYYYETFKSK